MKRGTLLAILYSLIFYSCNGSVDDLTLELVQVIFRHGARTPGIQEAHLINAKNPPTFPLEGGYDQLTNLGKRQAYTLGTSLRERYDDFLGAYDPRECYAVTTPVTRTRMSLQLVLAGLFPPEPENSWNSKLRWRPVPFHNHSPSMRITMEATSVKKYMDLLTETYESLLKNEVAKYAEFFELLEKKTSVLHINMLNIGWAYSAIKCLEIMNLPPPNWYQDDLIKTKLKESFDFILENMSYTPELRRFFGGTLVRRFIENINENRDAVVSKKIYLYASHDLTIYGFLKAQNADPCHIHQPKFGSSVIVEKYSDSQKSEYVRALAWDPAEKETFEPVKIGNCSEYCPFNDYLKIVENNLPTDKILDYMYGDTN